MTSVLWIKYALVAGILGAMLTPPAVSIAGPLRRPPDRKATCTPECGEKAYRAVVDLYNQQKYAEALAVWDQLYAEAPIPLLLSNIANALYKLGRCDEAVAAFRLLSSSGSLECVSPVQEGVDLQPAQCKTGKTRLQELEARCGSAPPLSDSGAQQRTYPVLTSSQTNTGTEGGSAAAAPQPVVAAEVPKGIAPLGLTTYTSAKSDAAPPSTPIDVKPPIYKRVWLWTTVGGVAAAAIAVGLGVGLGKQRDPEPTQGFRGMTFALAF